MTKVKEPVSTDIFIDGKDIALDPALERVLVRVRLRAQRRVSWLRKLWKEEGESGGKFAVTHAEIDSHLEDRDSPENEASWFASNGEMKSLNRATAEVESAMTADTISRFAQLHRIFGLNPRESDLLQLCIAARLDPSLARVYAYLHDHAGRGYATEELAARIFTHGRRSLWTPDSPLRRWELISEKEAAPGEPSQLICDTLILNWLQGNNCLDESLAGIARLYEPRDPLENWPVDENVEFLSKMFKDGNSRIIRLHITGPPGSGRRTLAALISARIGLSLRAIDTDQVDDQHWHRIFVRAQRQAYLDQCALAWHGEHAHRRAWPTVVHLFPVQFMISETKRSASPIPGVIDHAIEIPVLSLEERRALWSRFIPESSVWPKEPFNNLVSQHRATVGDIASAAECGIHGVDEATEVVCESARQKLGNLAHALECPFSWDDMVIPDNLGDALRDLAFEATERVAFWERADARRLFPQGRGLLGLFSGSPGTGKTMAAQIVAASLGLDLFRIDLSSVVSKYVGETSQNLERILSRAAQMDVVLLFDEADALFGKRTEIRDAHDRFANTDTGYLLQAIENYRGVAILATNRKGNIDPAFIRRIRFVLEFPRPDATQRERIWQKIIKELVGPKHVKELTKDIKALAEDLDLTGAQIKFSVLSALFAAKRDRKKLSLSHLLRGIDRELMKEGRALSERERERLHGHGK